MNRLQCACVFTDGAKELDERLKKLDNLGNNASKEVIKELKAILDIMKKDYHDHVTTYNRERLRSTIELQKIHAINPFNVPPLQTNGWKAGDLKRIREPPPKKKKDEKKNKRSKK